MNYCVYGTESFLVKKKIESIIEEEKIIDNGMNLVVYDAVNHDFSISKVIEDCWTIPFLSDKKVIHVRNCGFLSSSHSLSENDQNLILDYLNHPCNETILIFSGFFDKIDNRKKIGKNITKLMKCHQCNALDEQQFHAYVKERLKKNKISLSEEALQELFGRLRSDMMAFENVLDKLVLYPNELDKQAIKSLVSRPLEDNVFDLVNEVVNGNLKKSMHIWRDLQVFNTDAIGLLSLISMQFRLLYQVKILSGQRKSEADIASILKVHPYRIKLAKKSCISISVNRLETLIKLCADLDQQFKNGTIDRTLGFETFLIQTSKR